LQALTQTFARAARAACAKALAGARVLTHLSAAGAVEAPTDDDVREDDCALCAGWPTGLRPVLRTAIDSVPLSKPVCDRCEEAFWANVVRFQDQRLG